MQILLCITTNIPDYVVSGRNEPEKTVYKNSFYAALQEDAGLNRKGLPASLGRFWSWFLIACEMASKSCFEQLVMLSCSCIFLFCFTLGSSKSFLKISEVLKSSPGCAGSVSGRP